MDIGTLLLIILYSIIGGLPTLGLFISIPAILGWKIYRKIRYKIPVYN